jgi:hypothetical protein
VFAGLAFLSAILFVRTTGIHIDENNYLDAAVNSRLGDSKGSGKPPLFYWMNYKLQHEVARSFGPLKPITIYLFYIAAYSATLVWALLPFFRDRRKHLALTFFVLLLSPLALLNTTQLMMETAMLPVVSLLFGCVLRGGDRFWKLLRMFLVSLLLIVLKVTGIAVVILLAAVTVRRSKWITVALGTGALSGYLVNAATLRWIVQVENAHDYGGPSEILNIAAAWARLNSQDVYIWLFFVGVAATAGGLAYAHSRWRSGKATSDGKGEISDGALLMLAFGTLAFTLLMQSISIYGFARYNYPTLWLGLIASVLLVARYRVIVLLPLAAVLFIQSSSLWGTDLNRFNLWPSRTVVEFMESGGTILMAAPIHRLVVEQHFRNSSPCYAVESLNPQEERYYLQYFAFAFPKGKVAASSACDPTIRIWRDPVETVGGCPARCETSNKWHGCGYQNLVFFTFRPGLVLNQVCW